MQSGDSSHGQEGATKSAESADPARAFERLSKFEYDVFLSYSSHDRPRALAVVERLTAAGLRVFWDRDILSGALWRPKLTKSLKTSQCVLVLWSSEAKASSWVQAEAELALKLGVLQQALLEPLELDLPFNQHQLMADLSTWQPGERHEALELLVQKLKACIGEPVASWEGQLVRERLRQIRRARTRKQALRVAAPVALLVGILLGSGALDAVFGFDTRVRLISVWARGALTDHRLDDRITFVRIDDSTKGSLGDDYYETWRSQLALAIKNLALQGASVIALDYTFKTVPDKAGTLALAKAIETARAPQTVGGKGSAVVVGVKAWSHGQPVVAQEIRDALDARPGSAPGYLGVTCGGREGGFATTFPVLVSKPIDTSGALPPVTKPDKNLLPSLAFATALASLGTENFEWQIDADRIVLNRPESRLAEEYVRLSGWGKESHAASECTIIAEGDSVAKLIVEQAPAKNPWRYELAFQEVVKSATGLEDKVRGQICLIGDANELHSVWSAGPAKVPGVKLHADALSTLLHGVALRRLPPLSQLLLMLLLGTLAALSRFAIPPSRRSKRLGLLASLVAVDILLAAASAAYLGLFMDAGYHVLAILVSYWYAERIEGRFFARPASVASGELP